MTISLAMIVKNEADTLGHCLQSVRGLVDEIVLVDTGSTDATVEIARQEAARIFHFPWVDDFAAARNESLGHCTSDWILILDADEAIDALDHPLIRASCQAAAAQAYDLPIRNYHTSGRFYIQDAIAQENTSNYREGGEYPFYIDSLGLRLCRRLPDLAFTGRVHELLDPYFDSRNIPIQRLSGAVIHHFGKLNEQRESVKARLYLDLAQKDLQTDPANPQFHFNVVQQGLQVQDWPVVLASAEAYQRLQSVVPPMITFGAGLALQRLGRQPEALVCFDHLLRTHPDHGLALAHRGIVLVALGREAEAEQSYQKSIQVNPRHPLPYVSYAELAFNQGRIEVAKTIVRQGVANCPLDPVILFAAASALQRLGRQSEALVYFDQLLRTHPDHAPALAHQGIALVALGRQAEAEQSFKQAIQVNPRYTLPYVNYTELAFNQGRIEEARAIIQQGVVNCPSDPLMLGGLLLFDLRTHDMEQAMVHARRALEALPEEGGGLWHRLSALFEQRAGRRLEAIAILDRGLALFPENVALRKTRDDFAAQAED